MPGVINYPPRTNDQEVELIRRAIRNVDDEDRTSLWSILNLLDRVDVRGGDLNQVVKLARAAIRPTVAMLAALRISNRGISLADQAKPPPPEDGYRRPLLTTIRGRACEPDTWLGGWSWTSFAPDSLADAADRLANEPREVLYGHDGPGIGLTRRWRVCEDGGLDVELRVLPIRRAQLVARYCKEGDVRGLSVGVRTVRSSWDYTPWSEWEPRTGTVDMQRRHAIDIQELSLTPTPALPACQVRTVW